MELSDKIQVGLSMCGHDSTTIVAKHTLEEWKKEVLALESETKAMKDLLGEAQEWNLAADWGKEDDPEYIEFTATLEHYKKE